MLSGIHSVNGGKWNAVWQNWIRANQDANSTEVLQQMQKMIDQFKLRSKYTQQHPLEPLGEEGVGEDDDPFGEEGGPGVPVP